MLIVLSPAKSLDFSTTRANASSTMPEFLDDAEIKEIKGGKSRTIATFAKRARRRMVAWIIRNRIDTPAKLTRFDADGYKFVGRDSTGRELVFARPQPAPARI